MQEFDACEATFEVTDTLLGVPKQSKLSSEKNVAKKSVSKDDALAAFIQALPSPLQDMILEHKLKNILAPGKIVFGKDLNKRMPLGNLLIPNKNLHKTATNILYSTNTWVVPKGEGHEARMFYRLPQDSLAKIKSMELAFSWDDAWSMSPGDEVVYINRKANERRRNGEVVDKAMIAQEWFDECENWVDYAIGIWESKMCMIEELRLDHLKLDFTECFSIEGFFLGAELALELSPMPYGLPPHFEVVAPTREMERDIMEVFESDPLSRRRRRSVCSFCENGLH